MEFILYYIEIKVCRIDGLMSLNFSELHSKFSSPTIIYLKFDDVQKVFYAVKILEIWRPLY